MRGSFVAIVVWIVTASACQTSAFRHPPPRPIVPVASTVPLVRHVQKLTIQWQNERRVLLGVVELGDLYASMALLTPEGVVLLDVLQTVDDLVIDRNPGVSEQIPPERILADVQLINWPADSLQQAYRAPWHFEQTADRRRVSLHDRVILDVRYHPGVARWRRAEMSVPEFGYHMEVTQLAEEDF